MSKDRFAAAHDDCGERHKGTRVGTIWANWNEVTGDVTLTVDFLNRTSIERLDILRDVIGVLEREYAATLHGLHNREDMA